VGSLDLPDQPDEVGRAMQADAGGMGRPTPKSRELPDPDERGRAYEAMRAHVSAETPEEALPGRVPDAGDQGSCRDDVPRSHDAWADHDRREPERQHAAVDRSGDRPELPAATDEATGQVREAGRTPSADAQAIDQENKHGGWLAGVEFRLDGEDRLKEKLGAETAEEDSPGQLPDAADQRNYWDEVPRFRDMWVDHERRWPERHSATEPDRSSDPPGTYRSNGGLKLNPEQHAETKEAIRHMREAEKPISADMQIIGRENTNGGWLEGFGHRIKGDDRLKEKVAEQVAAEPDKLCSLILRKVPDALRYTYCFEPDNYTNGYDDVKTRLENQGHEMYQSANYWTDPEYKGINTRWMSQLGQRFEVQFHTPESFHAKEYVTHKAYERLRTTQITAEERGELEDFQREVSSHIRVPDGAADIPDAKKEGF
jgi:hypothetical protein